MKPRTSYLSPFSERYGSKEMRYIWSEARRYAMYREVWTYLAQAYKDAGYEVDESAVNDMSDKWDSTNIERLQKIEEVTKHDIAAHIECFCEDVPLASNIIHIGETSQFVIDNSEAVMVKESLFYIIRKANKLLEMLTSILKHAKDQRMVGYTHLQPAQITTWKKRVAGWAQEISMALEGVAFRLDRHRTRGLGGAVGTNQAALDLLGDIESVGKARSSFINNLGFEGCGFKMVGQTYPRTHDSALIASLSVLASAVSKMGMDIRFLCGMGQLASQKEEGQVGSSAMPYKTNPILWEKINSLSRVLQSHLSSALTTSSTQVLERTLDDSAGRRAYLPESFIAMDEILDSAIKGIGTVSPSSKANEDLQRSMPVFFLEFMMNKLIKSGMSRTESHKAVTEIKDLVLRDSDMTMEEFVDKIEFLKKGGLSTTQEDLRVAIANAEVALWSEEFLQDNYGIGTVQTDVEIYIKEVLEPTISHYRGV